MTHPLIQFRRDIKDALPTFGLATEKEQERLSSVMMVAVDKDPGLLAANRASLIAAARKCASHGLLPDGNEAVLQVYNTQVSDNGTTVWVQKVVYNPMVRGIIKRVLRSGDVHTFWAEVVYEGEEFNLDISQGDRRPTHTADYLNRKGDVVGAYAVAKMANGTIDTEVLTMAEIEKIKGVAKAKNVWANWFEEKAKVAALRRLSKRLKLSSEDMDAIMNPGESDFTQAEPEVPAEPAEPEMNLAQRLKNGDVIDGEIILEPDPASDAYNAGVQAYIKGGDNPFEEGSQEWVSYVAGWDFGEEHVNKANDNPGDK
jgi:recombination protein RecT